MTRPIVFGVLFTILSSSLCSALMVDMSLDQLSRSSNTIIRGHVVAQHSYWVSSPRAIETDILVVVDDTWTGHVLPGQPLMVRVRGGRVGTDAIIVEDEPSFETGEEAVLFLND